MTTGGGRTGRPFHRPRVYSDAERLERHRERQREHYRALKEAGLCTKCKQPIAEASS